MIQKVLVGQGRAGGLFSLILLVALLGGCATGKERRLSASRVMAALGLEAMPDDACPGFYRPTYQSGYKADTPDRERAAASLIYYMMTREKPRDPWHILTSDEVLLYHAGAPMIQLLLYPDGSWEEVVLGPEAERGQVMQKVIPAGTWMGFVLRDDPWFDWGLYGVMVVPGWHIDDIRMLQDLQERERLKNSYPEAVPRARELGLF